MSKRKDKYLELAEKIVEGLIEDSTVIKAFRNGVIKFRTVFVPTLDKAIAKAIEKKLTYGNLATMTLRNNKGQITAKLYILPDGTLADDSWLCNKGWKK